MKRTTIAAHPRYLEMIATTLAIVGGGNMARALIRGLIAGGRDPATVRVGEPDATRRAQLAREFPGIALHADNVAATRGASLWLLAVKPPQMAAVAASLAEPARRQRPLVLSVAAGIRAAALTGWLGAGVPVVRCMPNRAVMLGAGITGLFARPGTPAEARARAETLFAEVGATVWIDDETDLDVVTAVSGSGPAYVFLLIEMLEEAAVAEGLTPAVARRLAVEAVAGAARMARESAESPVVLRGEITSTAGTTAAALAVLDAADVRSIFRRAVHAARSRAAELAEFAAGA